MRIPMTILAVTALLLAALWWLGPAPDPALQQARNDLPWQVTTLPGGGARVFGLDLGSAALVDAEARFGPTEDLAVFADATGRQVLEAYFGTVRFGPLDAKVIVALDLPEAELLALVGRAVAREGSPSGAWKFKLTAADRRAQQARPVRAITYIPGARDLDAAFFRERFGEPAAWLAPGEGAVQWFYPERGVTVVIDARGREVIEYTAPRTFVLPDAAQRTGTAD